MILSIQIPEKTEWIEYILNIKHVKYNQFRIDKFPDITDKYKQ